MSKHNKTILKQAVGTDMSKDDFKICYKTTSSQKTSIRWTTKFANTAKGIKSFLSSLQKKQKSQDAPMCIVVEATGVYHQEFVYAVYSAGYDVKLILPTKTHHYAKSFSHNSKTDADDAKLLADYGLERGHLEKSWQPSSPKVLSIQQLCRQYAQMQKTRTAEKNRLHAVNHMAEFPKSVEKHLKQHIKFLDKVLKDIEKELKEVVASDAKFSKMVMQLCSIPGVAFKTATRILAETDCFLLFTSFSQVVRYAGYDVVHKESGTSVKGKSRISKKGNGHIRAALHFPAITAVKHNPVFRNLKERVQARSGIKMKGYTAVQRKLLCLMYTLIKNDTTYDLQKHIHRVEQDAGLKILTKIADDSIEKTLVKQ
jgi:transposase